ncbi:MAG TPA: DUF1289 domain-containing protein [Candidatus Methylopumilus sp.]
MIESPCIGVCTINKEHQFCEGCFRSKDEISEWIRLSDDQKKEINQLAAQRQINLISF